MNILVTGSKGQLGNEIRRVSVKSGNQYIFTDVEELDITDRLAVEHAIDENSVDIVVNCAAYTNVEKAEDERAVADKINHLAVENIALACKKYDCLLIHISTDYVFSGNGCVPYKEEDEISPLGVYGETKRKGEESIEVSGCKSIILRTAWLYSSFGHNFVKTMLHLTEEKNLLKVVFDQVGTPTYAGDLAFVIYKIIENHMTEKTGIYHFSNEGVCSWYDFAKDICSVGKNICHILPCHSDEFPSKVKRPHYSVLDKTKIKETFDLKIPYWRDSLKKCIEEIKKSGNKL